MKPPQWDKLNADEKRDMASQLFNSIRGHLLISQALHYGIKAMKAVPDPYKEVSNIEDLEMLREALFTFPVHDRDEDGMFGMEKHATKEAE